MRRNGIVGMSAAVVSGGQPLLSAGYGYADRAHRVPVTADSVFPLGSVTKLFTATAVMQLVERGAVDLDAPASRYLEGTAPQGCLAPGPTVRQLLTHHGGLTGNYMEGFELARPDPTAFRALPRLIARTPAVSAPDTIFAYSNSGYSLLGSIVEGAGGTAYTRFVTRNILEPLGMSRTRFFASEADGAESVMGYDGRTEVPVYAIRDLAAGALMSTATDMERFMRFIFDHGREGVLGRDSFAEMTRRQNARVVLDGEFSIGLGYWLVRPFAAEDPFASHGGDLPPFHTILVTVPERRIGVFLAANSSGASSALIPLAVEMVRKLYSRQTGRAVLDPPLPARVRLAQESLERWQGTYASPMGLIEVKARRGRLLARMQGLPLEIVPRADGSCTAELRILGLVSVRLPQLAPLRVVFLKNAGGVYVRVTAMGMLAGVGERFTPSEVPEAWQARSGRYSIVRRGENAAYRWPQDVSLRFERAHGMMLTYRLAGLRAVCALETPDESRAVIRGLGTGLGDTITARDEGGSAFLEWSGLLLKRK
jgi:CubicO group peptidase (beta-lactamase class C family)